MGKDISIISDSIFYSLKDRQYNVPKIHNSQLKPITSVLHNLFIQLETLHVTFASYTMNERISETTRVAVIDGIERGDIVNKTGTIIGKSGVVIVLKEHIKHCAEFDFDILIEGETGSGKQLTAEAIHRLSRRNKGEFVTVNCSKIDENLLLDTLFGHKKGAFTGADNDRSGVFIEANGGTLFLDEIQSASSKMQQALLRVLAERVFRPLGSDVELNVDVRIICAANVNLYKQVIAGEFREDLYFRLNSIRITVPSLRDRQSDISLLVKWFICIQCAHASIAEKEISSGALAKLCNYSWPGNVRELKNCITRAIVFSKGAIIQMDDIDLGYNELTHNTSGENSASNTEYNYFDETYSVSKQPVRDVQSNNVVTNNNENYTREFPNNNYTTTLNVRQKHALHFILQGILFSRTEYEAIFTTPITSRTANNDLKKLLTLNIISKIGSGPATQYICTKTAQKNLIEQHYIV